MKELTDNIIDIFIHRQTIGNIFKLLSMQFGTYEKNDRCILHNENTHFRHVFQQKNIRTGENLQYIVSEAIEKKSILLELLNVFHGQI